jgi:type I restriction enzyme S subunit
MRVLSVRRAAIARWDVKSHSIPSWEQSVIHILRPVGELAMRRIEPATSEVPLGSIDFAGHITLRNAKRTSKGSTFRARAGDVVFSRIDVRNGAIGVLGDEGQDLAFSSEYPIYDLSGPALVRPAYMRLLCRTTVFRAQINAQVIGHSGRKRLPAEEFEKLMLPVPGLAEQDAILEELSARNREARDLRNEALPLITQAGADMLERLGVRVPDFATIRGPFDVQRSKIVRWSVRKGMAAKQGAVQEITSDGALHPLGEKGLSEVAYGVTKSPGNRPGANARPYLRVANVQDGFLDLNVMKQIDVAPQNAKQYELETGDLLLCEGNSRELVGRPAIWNGEIEGCVHQNHVLRVRVNRDRLLPEFVFAYMHGPVGRWYFDDCAKQTTNLATINSSDVKALPIPVPDLSEQERLAAIVQEARSRADSLRNQANRLEVATAEWLAARLGSMGTVSEDVEDGAEEPTEAA